MRAEDRIRCDGLGCNESHPIDHDHLDEPGFSLGRWLGWLYLDLNRPDLAHRPFRFCSMSCLLDWAELATRRSHLSPQEHPIDAILHDTGKDEIAARRQIELWRKTVRN